MFNLLQISCKTLKAKKIIENYFHICVFVELHGVIVANDSNTTAADQSNVLFVWTSGDSVRKINRS